MEAAAKRQRDPGRTNQRGISESSGVMCTLIKCRIIRVMQSTKQTNCTMIGRVRSTCAHRFAAREMHLADERHYASSVLSVS